MRPEIAIQGAGPVGCALALLLKAQGSPVELVQPRKLPPASSRPALRPALRPLALSHASRMILERVGAWERLAPTPIENIHVSQQGGFGRAQLRAQDAGVPALGYVLDYRDLLEALTSLVAAQRIPPTTNPDDAALVVHAEGTSEDVREKEYGQEAIVALVTTHPAAGATAWERFTPEGPLALLPLGGRLALVWGMSPDRAKELCEAPEAGFLAALTRAIGRRAGEFTSVADRARAPLSLRVRRSRVGERAAYIGNAAQTLHPVAGQGLNLGLRDAWDLAQVLRGAPDPGDLLVLQRFSRLRRADAATTVRATDFLASAFLGNDPVAGWMRGFGLTALDICLPARRFFARRMIFCASALP